MRTQAECLKRRARIREELQDSSLPEDIRRSLEAQEDILTWIVEGDCLPDEYLIEGRLKFSGDVFTHAIIAGVDSGGRVYPAERVEKTGDYVLARRPTPQELEERRQGNR